MHLVEIINKIKNTSSTNTKVEIIRQYSSEKLRKLFKLVYDPTLVYKVKKLEVSKSGKLSLENKFEEVVDTLLTLSELNGVNNKVLNDIIEFIEKFDKENQELLINIIRKDLKCNLGSTLVERVYPGLFIKSKIMLCTDKPQNLKSEWFGQVKMDGTRSLIINLDGDVKIASRNHREYIIKPKHIVDYIESLGLYGVFDGEFVCVNKNGKLLDRKTSNGIMNKIAKGKASQDEVDSVRFFMWDYITPTDYVNELGTINYSERFVNVFNNNIISTDDLINNATLDLPVYILESHKFNDMKSFMAFTDKLIDSGLEGSIAKNDTPWENKRSKNCIKFKKWHDSEFKIIRVIEGTGKNSNMMGAIEISGSYKGKPISCNVGTGFSDEDRKWFWENKYEVLGKVCTIKFNEVIKSKTSLDYSLFLPVFLEFDRFDI